MKNGDLFIVTRSDEPRYYKVGQICEARLHKYRNVLVDMVLQGNSWGFGFLIKTLNINIRYLDIQVVPLTSTMKTLYGVK